MFCVLYITGGYFILGAIATLLANKGKEKEIKRERWLKIVTYFIIVHFILLTLLLLPSAFSYIASFIVITGAYEIIKSDFYKRHNVVLVSALVLYLTIATGFLLFCFTASSEGLIDLVLLVFIFDGFSQITGQLFGKRKMLPKVSPGKTIEGAIGGFIVTLLSSLFLVRFNSSKGEIILFTSLICFSALAGDLAASWYKRIMGIKDFSNLIPGHGGVLDQFDSLIVTGFMATILGMIYFTF